MENVEIGVGRHEVSTCRGGRRGNPQVVVTDGTTLRSGKGMELRKAFEHLARSNVDDNQFSHQRLER